jgi:hypothetical protein
MRITPNPKLFFSGDDILDFNRVSESTLIPQIRPGVYEDVFMFKGIKFTRFYYECQCCKIESDFDHMFMLKDDLWKLIAPNHGSMCFVCAEVKLGRMIEDSDLTDAPCNRVLKYVLRTRMKE